jgi:hypothetical protein
MIMHQRDVLGTFTLREYGHGLVEAATPCMNITFQMTRQVPQIDTYVERMMR